MQSNSFQANLLTLCFLRFLLFNFSLQRSAAITCSSRATPW